MKRQSYAVLLICFPVCISLLAIRLLISRSTCLPDEYQLQAPPQYHGGELIFYSDHHRQYFLSTPCSSFTFPEEGKLVAARILDVKFEMMVYHHGSVGDIVSDHIRRSGSWEKDETERLLKLLECTTEECPSRVFVDVGANIGWFSLVALHMGHTVIAFEPFKRNVELFCASLAKMSSLENRSVFSMLVLTSNQDNASFFRMGQ